MSQNAHSLIERYYANFNAAAWDNFLSLLTEDVAHDLNQGAREVGRAAFAAFMKRMNNCYRERIVDITILTNSEDTQAAAEFTVFGEYLRTDEGLPEARGQRYQLRGGAFFDIRGDKVARVTNYYNLQEWLRQVGG